MNTNLERVAAKAQKETNLKFSSLAHHITRELIRESLGRMPKYTAPGIDHKTVEGALKDFDLWIEDLIESIHRKSYKPPAVRRVWIPK
ncbi:MAG: group II intron reverse transcriptase/maturase, partial [Desulfosporosinus sp.]